MYNILIYIMYYCNVIDCKRKSKPIIGHCSYCKFHFCLKHRLPEQHECKEQEICNNKARQDLTNKLNQEAIKSKKI
jgi:predicted nucleic acid binding AN1-type Zn finger protein